MKCDRWIVGFVVGLVVPVVGYAVMYLVVETINELLDEGLPRFFLRPRTHYLLALAFNIVPVHWANDRYYTNVVRGLVSATMLYAAVWLWLFYREVL